MARRGWSGLRDVRRKSPKPRRASPLCGAVSAQLHLLIQKPLLDNNETPKNTYFGITTLSLWEFSLNTKQHGLNSGPACLFAPESLATSKDGRWHQPAYHLCSGNCK